MSISLIISDARWWSFSLEMMYLISNLRYFYLKVLIIPAARSCTFDVTFLGRNTNFMLDKLFSIDLRWLVALSRNNNISILHFHFTVTSFQYLWHYFAVHPSFFIGDIMHTERSNKVTSFRVFDTTWLFIFPDN